MQTSFLLPVRLQILANHLDSGEILADIGTDHAYLPIYAVQNGIVKRAIACDIHRPPLQSAFLNIEKFELTNLIDCRLGNGLAVLNESEINIITMAGLGGLSIRSILNEDLEKAKKANSILLQPNNHEGDLRLWLAVNGFRILEEGVIKDRKHFYQWMKVTYDGFLRKIDAFEAQYGKLNLTIPSPTIEEWLSKERKRLSQALRGMKLAQKVLPDELEQCILTIEKLDELLKK
jgi:tRNA (adenine22-N1)-methyltransferase